MTRRRHPYDVKLISHPQYEQLVLARSSGDLVGDKWRAYQQTGIWDEQAHGRLFPREYLPRRIQDLQAAGLMVLVDVDETQGELAHSSFLNWVWRVQQDHALHPGALRTGSMEEEKALADLYRDLKHHDGRKTRLMALMVRYDLLEALTDAQWREVVSIWRKSFAGKGR